MNFYRILVIGLIVVSLGYNSTQTAKKSPHYIPSPKEVLTKDEYKDVYGPRISPEQRVARLKTLLTKTTDLFKKKGIQRGIQELEFQIRAAR